MSQAAPARSKYLRFRVVDDSKKTAVISVDSRSGGQRLATIKWYGAWRQYTVFPESNTVWNKTCLQDVITFIDRLMAARRRGGAS